MTIRYTRDFSAQDFLELAQQVWPGPYDLQEVTLALKYTLNIGACDDDRLVGSVRVLTDGYFVATVPEILVLPDYRRRGIGRELMRRAVEVAPRGGVFFGAQPSSVSFFERIGCKRSLTGFEIQVPEKL